MKEPLKDKVCDRESNRNEDSVEQEKKGIIYNCWRWSLLSDKVTVGRSSRRNREELHWVLRISPSVYWYMSSSCLVWRWLLLYVVRCSRVGGVVYPIGCPIRRYDSALKSCQPTSAAQHRDLSLNHNQNSGHHILTTSSQIRECNEQRRRGDQLSPRSFKSTSQSTMCWLKNSPKCGGWGSQWVGAGSGTI